MKLQRCVYLYLALWLVFPCAVAAVWMAGYNLLVGTTGTAFFIQRILNWSAAACGIFLAAGHYRKTGQTQKNKVMLAAAVTGIAPILLCWNFLCAFLDSTEEYHSFPSPDGRHTVVLMEKVSLISGRVVLYERANPFLICPKDCIITDDGYRPVCAGKYALAWEGDTVSLSAFDGAGETKTISVLLREH